MKFKNVLSTAFAPWKGRFFLTEPSPFRIYGHRSSTFLIRNTFSGKRKTFLPKTFKVNAGNEIRKPPFTIFIPAGREYPESDCRHGN